MAKKKKIQAVDIIILTVLTLLMLVVMLPFYYTIVKSLMTQKEYIYNGATLFPKEITFQNYKYIFTNADMIQSFKNSVFYTFVGVAYNMFLTTTLAYALSRKNYPFRRFFQNMVIFTMYFGGGLIPYFLLVKNLNLTGTRWALIIPMGLNIFNMILMRNFFEQLPLELEESAMLDGAQLPIIFARIHLPLIKPALATMVLFYAVDRWNEWFYASLFLGKSKLWPLQLQLRQILWTTNSAASNIPAEAGRQMFSEGIKAASVIVVILPIMILYPFLQKYFVKGALVGSIKS